MRQQKRIRAKNLTDKRIKEIVEILDGWGNKKLTWALLLDEIRIRYFMSYTRQTLSSYERIRNAFTLMKNEQHGVERGSKKPSSPQLKIAYERIARLEAENNRLKSENNNLLVQFVTWAYNAYTRGLDENFLNRPLPRVDRGQTLP